MTDRMFDPFKPYDSSFKINPEPSTLSNRTMSIFIDEEKYKQAIAEIEDLILERVMKDIDPNDTRRNSLYGSAVTWVKRFCDQMRPVLTTMIDNGSANKQSVIELWDSYRTVAEFFYNEGKLSEECPDKPTRKIMWPKE